MISILNHWDARTHMYTYTSTHTKTMNALEVFDQLTPKGSSCFVLRKATEENLVEN